ncbi:unnamed protein product, partial [Mesorhabditis belari]|uniref:SAM domain-containing protein n=1 Tax=Mesorhabditis belari TaxID=2138241 RepID=A0AAF3EDA0_9BILA
MACPIHLMEKKGRSEGRKQTKHETQSTCPQCGVRRSMSAVQEVYQVVTHRPMCFWTSSDVDEWLRRRRPKLALKYALHLIRHNITGRVLVEMTDVDLQEIGINSFDERQDLLLEILREKLAGDFDEMDKLRTQN